MTEVHVAIRVIDGREPRKLDKCTGNRQPRQRAPGAGFRKQKIRNIPDDGKTPLKLGAHRSKLTGLISALLISFQRVIPSSSEKKIDLYQRKIP